MKRLRNIGKPLPDIGKRLRKSGNDFPMPENPFGMSGTSPFLPVYSSERSLITKHFTSIFYLARSVLTPTRRVTRGIFVRCETPPGARVTEGESLFK
ncbi:MAG TPA: hypothetical protein VGH42_12985 [Verrucomicrobiae bacterium]|jgi:hypothetical protein